MYRHPVLRGLSDDHHDGLVQARRLRKAAVSGDSAQVEEALAAFLVHWRDHIRVHFGEEEEVLAPLFGRVNGWEEPLLARMSAEHARLRSLAMAVEDGDRSPAIAAEIGQALDEHIRFEERLLFPRVQELLSNDQMRELGARLSHAEAERPVPKVCPTTGAKRSPRAAGIAPTAREE
jgi:hemerythrin-like domain-containing protein